MTFRTAEIGGFEFVRLSALRAAQLMQGCIPRVPACHKPTSTAQREVASGKVRRLLAPEAGVKA
jgi:DNA-directed RNA polymerase subunit K/omega